MSQSNAQVVMATGTSRPGKVETWATKAALLPSTPGSLDDDFIASEALGSPVDIDVRLVASTSFGQEGLAFSLSFPHGSIETIEGRRWLRRLSQV